MTRRDYLQMMAAGAAAAGSTTTAFAAGGEARPRSPHEVVARSPVRMFHPLGPL